MTAPQSTIFAVVDEPYCLWEVDVRARNLAFLNGIDAEYFEYLARSGVAALDGAQDKKRAAANLRLGFYNGTETLFSLLGALLQAPSCAYAWMAQCATWQLRELLRRVNERDATLLVKVKLGHLSWEGIAKGVLAYSSSDPAKAERNGTLFGCLWDRLASEYLQDVHIKEYNSLKHGFRVRHGGFGMAVGIEHEYGVPPPPEEMQFLGASDFGSTFYVLDQVGGEDRSNRSRRSRQVSVNWSAEGMVLALQLISMSIRNVVSMLQILNGRKPSEVRFMRPSEDNDFDRPWEHSPSVLNAKLDFVIPEEAVKRTTKQELLDIWHKKEAR